LSEISDKARVRLLGGGLGEKPAAALPQTSSLETAPRSDAAPSAPATSPAGGPIFLSDSADGADLLEAGQVVQPLAQLCVTAQVQTPILAALAGPGGAGKTFALKRLAQAIESLGGSPGALSRVVVARVDAADGVEAPVALASAAYAALDREPGGIDYSSLLDESAHAFGDPLRAAKAASDRHDEIVRKLEAERLKRDEVEARRARLAETLLYETPGSRVDVFARSRRGAIESRLRRFELAGPDAALSYRDLVRDMASMSAGGRAGTVLRSIWGIRSQRQLLSWAIVAFLLGFALNLLRKETALAAIRDLAAPLEPITSWIGAHSDAFGKAALALWVLGALALALNLFRAVSFSTLLLRGTQLLDHELRDRRRDLETRLGRLNQRVAALSADADATARVAEAAARRAGAKAQARAPGPDFLEANQGPAAAARAFLVAIAERVGQGPEAPDRLVFVIDNLDALSSQAAIGWIDAAQGVVGPGSIGIIALDPARLVDTLGGAREARRRFDKWLQVVVNLPGRTSLDGERLVARLLSTDGKTASPTPDPKVAGALVEPLSSSEAALLTALAPLVAHSPRDAKRFLNAYRLARCSNAPRPVIALMQAIAFADDGVRNAMDARISAGSGELGEVEGPEPLVKALRSARSANNGEIQVSDARAAADIARRYALSL
jgi:outer membrane murein-binding lipoprotein Lpp